MGTILIVDDDGDLRALVRTHLDALGFDVLEAANGLEGIEIARERVPDVVIIDLRMPVMDGWAAIPILKDDPKTCDIPVVVLTTESGPDDRRLAEGAGCDAFHTKPVDMVALVARLHDLLQGS